VFSFYVVFCDKHKYTIVIAEKKKDERGFLGMSIEIGI